MIFAISAPMKDFPVPKGSDGQLKDKKLQNYESNIPGGPWTRLTRCRSPVNRESFWEVSN